MSLFIRGPERVWFDMDAGHWEESMVDGADGSVEYVRADVVAAELKAERERIVNAIDAIVGMHPNEDLHVYARAMKAAVWTDDDPKDILQRELAHRDSSIRDNRNAEQLKYILNFRRYGNKMSWKFTSIAEAISAAAYGIRDTGEGSVSNITDESGEVLLNKEQLIAKMDEITEEYYNRSQPSNSNPPK